MSEANKLNYVPLLRKQVELYTSIRCVSIKTLLPAKPVLESKKLIKIISAEGIQNLLSNAFI